MVRNVNTLHEEVVLSVMQRLVHMDRVKRSRIGQFLRMRKSWSVRKFSILLLKRMRFMQVWTSLKHLLSSLLLGALYSMHAIYTAYKSH